MKKYEKLSLVLLIISGILWGLIGLFHFDLMPYLAQPSWIVRVLYFIFGVAAIYVLMNWSSIKKSIRSK